VKIFADFSADVAVRWTNASTACTQKMEKIKKTLHSTLYTHLYTYSIYEIILQFYLFFFLLPPTLSSKEEGRYSKLKMQVSKEEKDLLAEKVFVFSCSSIHFDNFAK
jgi:hypothetical protein